jgi:prevent-host-death family protein
MVPDAHTVGLPDLRHHTTEVLARVRHGETINVTDHGRLIARIVPVGEHEPTPVLARLVEAACNPRPAPRLPAQDARL